VEKRYIFRKSYVHMKHPKNCTFTIVNVQTGPFCCSDMCVWCCKLKCIRVCHSVNWGNGCAHSMNIVLAVALLCCNTVVLFLYKYIKAQIRFHVVDISPSLCFSLLWKYIPFHIITLLHSSSSLWKKKKKKK
jgi:hypothetical protein